MNFQNNFLRITVWVLTALLISSVILTTGRVIFLFQQIDVTMLGERYWDLCRALFVGLRYDLKVATIAFAPLYLLAIVVAAFPALFNFVKKCLLPYASIIFFLLTAFSIGNYYYYITFGNYFDVFVFGLFDDDTKAVLESAWSDYPIVFALLFTVTITVAASKLLHKVIASKRFLATKSWHWSMVSIAVFVAILVYVGLARGSFSTLPLKRYHANVSDYDVLNKATPNAFMALDWARGDYKEQTKFEPIGAELLTTQMNKVLGQPTPEYHTPTNEYLENNKPHIVMTLMEGFGSNVLLEDDAEKNDLLASLRQPFEDDFVFKRFLASTSATIDSMMMMLFHSSNPSISHSSVQKVVMPGSAVMPYKREGYEVVYITPGNAMWRNLANYLPLQGFDKIVDENTLIRTFPEAKKYADTWGVPDEYAFKYAEKILNSSDKPLLIYILTVTNHSPFKAPESYQVKPVEVSERLNQLLGPLKEHGTALLSAYQYANDAFGQFITNIKGSPLANNTLIAGTGDHRMRYLDGTLANEFAINYAVPFYLYVPQKILQNVPFQYDSQRIGSHRDIFPTLYNFSLSDASYISLGGNNLLSTQSIESFGYNAQRVINEQGSYDVYQPEKLYPWADDQWHSEESAVDNPNPQQGKEYRKLQDYYLRWQVAQ